MQKAQQGIEAAQQEAPKPRSDTPTLPQLGAQQKDVKALAEQLLAAQQGVNDQAMQNAAQQLEQALNDVSPIAAGESGQIPGAAQQAVQAAQSALTQAAAQAGAKQQKPAQANAAQAAQALAQAQAAIALAQAGLSSEMAQGQGQQPGQGQTPGQGQGQGKQEQQGPGKGTPPPRGTGKDGNWSGAGGANGARSGTAGTGTFIGLPKRDRAAIQQSQAEKYPQEYGPLVEQYLKNLSDQGDE
jgi:hypothetical protein